MTWKVVIGWENLYEISEYGSIKSLATGRLRRTPLSNGYPHVQLKGNGRKEQFHVHNLVSKAFLGPKPPGYHVNHKDGNKQNNHWSNLEYVTPKDNMQHAVRTGLIHHEGRKNGNAKLNDEEVLEIYGRCRTGENQRLIAARFGIKRQTVNRISTRRGWQHLWREALSESVPWKDNEDD